MMMKKKKTKKMKMKMKKKMKKKKMNIKTNNKNSNKKKNIYAATVLSVVCSAISDNSNQSWHSHDNNKEMNSFFIMDNHT